MTCLEFCSALVKLTEEGRAVEWIDRMEIAFRKVANSRQASSVNWNGSPDIVAFHIYEELSRSCSEPLDVLYEKMKK